MGCAVGVRGAGGGGGDSQQGVRCYSQRTLPPSVTHSACRSLLSIHTYLPYFVHSAPKVSTLMDNNLESQGPQAYSRLYSIRHT